MIIGSQYIWNQFLGTGSRWARQGRLSRGPASRQNVPRTIWSELTWSGSSPWLAVKSSLSASLGQFMYIIHYAFIVYFTFRLDSVSFLLFSENIQFKCLCQFSSVQHYCLIIVSISIQLLFDYCSVFWSWKCIPVILIHNEVFNTCILKS